MGLFVVTPAALADGAADLPLLTDDAAVDEPLVVVDLDADVDAATAARAVYRARTPVRLLVGLRTRPEPLTPEQLAVAAALDTTVAPLGSASQTPVVAAPDPVSALDDLVGAVADQEHAAMVLAHVLRASETLSVPEALDVESLGYSTLLGTPGFRRWIVGRGPRPLPPPSPQQPVLVDRDGDRLHITLNRPERRNAATRTAPRSATVSSRRCASRWPMTPLPPSCSTARARCFRRAATSTSSVPLPTWGPRT
ncbi:hypothetical protein RHCRD62_30044 [Rhodococcus sp. RD6.2]|nr:hypothetical protein RHCRD62_30044 [Rhodococcus sp. RD6.2]